MILMPAAVLWLWQLVVILAVVWTGAALHTALIMRRHGRRWWVWFAVSLFLTTIPAAVCSYVDYFRELRRQRQAGGGAPDREPPRRCRHCGAVLPDEQDAPGAPSREPRPAGQATCPNCGMAIADEDIA